MKLFCYFVSGCVLLSVVFALLYFGARAVTCMKGYWSNERAKPIGQSISLGSSSEMEQICKSREQRSVVGSVVQGSVPYIPSALDPKQRMEEQLRVAASVFGFDLQFGFNSDDITTTPLSHKSIRNVSTQDGKYLSFDVKTGQLLTFYCTKSEIIPEHCCPNVFTAMCHRSLFYSALRPLCDLSI